LSINQETGFWLCFACGERGGIRSLAGRLGVVLNDADLALKVYEGSQSYVFEEPKDFAVLAEKLRAYLYKTRPQQTLDFLAARHLDPRVVKHFGLGFDGYRIAFPYYDDEVVHAIKYRDASGNKTMEDGSKLDGFYNVNDLMFKPYVIICEGESDTLAVWSQLTACYPSDIVERIGVVGVAGVSATNSKWDIRALDLLWAKKVYVAFDADTAGDAGALLAMTALPDKAVRIRPTLGKDMTDHFIAGGTLNDFGLEDALSIPIGVGSIG
jgi:DNA primase